MTNGHDPELRTWMDDWRDGTETGLDAPTAARLRRRARGRSVRLIAYTAAEVVASVITVVIFGYLIWVSPEPMERFFMASLIGVVLWAQWYSFWNRRGTWRALTATTSAYLAVSILRAERRLAALRFTWWLLSVELVLIAAWVGWRISASTTIAPEAKMANYVYLYVTLAVSAALASSGTRWLIRRTRREHADLLALREALSASDDAEPPPAPPRSAQSFGAA